MPHRDRQLAVSCEVGGGEKGPVIPGAKPRNFMSGKRLTSQNNYSNEAYDCFNFYHSGYDMDRDIRDLLAVIGASENIIGQMIIK